MTAPHYPEKDNLFCDLSGQLELCSVQSNKICQLCAAFFECLGWWDNVCNAAKNHRLTISRYQKYVRRFNKLMLSKYTVVTLVLGLLFASCAPPGNDYAQIIKEWEGQNDSARIALEKAHQETANVTERLLLLEIINRGLGGELDAVKRENVQLKNDLAAAPVQAELDSLRQSVAAYGQRYEGVFNELLALQELYSKLYKDNQDLQKRYELLRYEITANATVSTNRQEIYWKSTDVLRRWVKKSGIPTIYGGNPYITKEYDCEKFAIDLWLKARDDDRIIGLYLIEKWRDGVPVSWHLKNFTFKGNFVDGQSYLLQIEPQTGQVGPLSGREVRLD